MENVLATKVAFPLDRTKPLVKEFFDRNAEIETYLKVRLPHLPHYDKVKINRLYTKSDGVTHLYRVNWFAMDGTIPLSQHVEVITNKNGKVKTHRVD